MWLWECYDSAVCSKKKKTIKIVHLEYPCIDITLARNGRHRSEVYSRKRWQNTLPQCIALLRWSTSGAATRSQQLRMFGLWDAFFTCYAIRFFLIETTHFTLHLFDEIIPRLTLLKMEPNCVLLIVTIPYQRVMAVTRYSMTWFAEC